jgi:hypothetical protein
MSLCLEPVWKAPPYNSPILNLKRGMYAWSTAVFLVSFFLMGLRLIMASFMMIDGAPEPLHKPREADEPVL